MHTGLLRAAKARQAPAARLPLQRFSTQQPQHPELQGQAQIAGRLLTCGWGRLMGGWAPGGAAAGGGLAAGGGVARRAGMAGGFQPSSRSRCSRSSGPQGHRSRYLHNSSPGLRTLLAPAPPGVKHTMRAAEEGQLSWWTHASGHHKGQQRSAWHCPQGQQAKARPVLLKSYIEEVAWGQVWQGVPPALLQGCHLVEASQIILHLQSSIPANPSFLPTERAKCAGTCSFSGAMAGRLVRSCHQLDCEVIQLAK